MSYVLSRAPQFIVNNLVHELKFFDICLVQGPPVYCQPFGTWPPIYCHLFSPGLPNLLSTIWYMTFRILSSVRSRAPQFIVNHLVHDLQDHVIYVRSRAPQFLVNHLIHDLQFLDICSVQGPPDLLSTIWYMTSNLLLSPVRSRASQFIVNHLLQNF
jgi:hypothetical protein